jgi:glucose-1-phosphate thymidylyltransferase
MTSKWIASRDFSVKVHIVNDLTDSNEDRLGAIGDINLVLNEKSVDDDVLIVAGDNLFEFDIADFISFAKDKKSFCVALFDVKERTLAQKYGVVALDSGQKIERFQEKPQDPISTLASTGIYYLPKENIGCIHQYMKTGRVKDAPGNFVKWISESRDVFGYVFTEGWYDIGDKRSLEKADVEYRNREL